MEFYRLNREKNFNKTFYHDTSKLSVDYEIKFCYLNSWNWKYNQAVGYTWIFKFSFLENQILKCKNVILYSILFSYAE